MQDSYDYYVYIYGTCSFCPVGFYWQTVEFYKQWSMVELVVFSIPT